MTKVTSPPNLFGWLKRSSRTGSAGTITRLHPYPLLDTTVQKEGVTQHHLPRTVTPTTTGPSAARVGVCVSGVWDVTTGILRGLLPPHWALEPGRALVE
jgi:hypothetical protein